MLDIMRQRRSIRKYQNREVEEQVLIQVLEAARLAPSGHNQQPWEFVIVRDPTMREKLALINHEQMWMKEAPVHVIAVSKVREKEGFIPDFVDEESPYHGLKQGLRDASIATGYLLLAAQAAGLGSCWCGWHTQADVRGLLGIPEDRYVVGIITLGYPAEAPSMRPRKAMHELLHHEIWQEK